jgi:hypothetical protein
MCYALAENLSTFCSGPETLWEAQFNDNRLMNLVEEISRQPSILAVDSWCWFLLARFTSENWEQKAGQKDFFKCAVWPEKEHVESCRQGYIWARRLWVLVCKISATPYNWPHGQAPELVGPEFKSSAAPNSPLGVFALSDAK